MLSSHRLFGCGSVDAFVGVRIYRLLSNQANHPSYFPLLGRIRYLFELIRPEINQYFVESNSDGVPFSREQRSIVYQRAKRELDTLPFGTQMNLYAEGYEWVNHSLAPHHVDPASLRLTVGGSDCRLPYSASILNISAMSYGSLSKNAVLALNGGAKMVVSLTTLAKVDSRLTILKTVET